MVAPTDHVQSSAPKAATTKTDSEKSGTDMCRHQTFILLDAFVDFLLAEAPSAQPIDREMLLRRTRLFKKGITKEQDALFRDQFEACQVLRDQEVWDRVRKDPFKRLLTHRLSRLFPPEHGFDAPLADGLVSRRILPGLFLALEKMTGSLAFQDIQGRCREMLQDLFGDSGPINWQVFYDNVEANNAVDGFLIGIVPHFDDLAKRTVWLRDLINFELAPFSLYAFEGEGAHDWVLDTPGAVNILRALFHNLRQRLALGDSGRSANLRENAHCETLEAFLRTLYAPTATPPHT
ncbi:hypothetical protein [Varunaivibrio sulfuroxidans]|uniref:Uncharacterized protein n=1 Tax=Varunaivibrio sulfuroxidans TaxID=1773489 RepID=A0A4V2UN40_9PROT|nr:hypothetical protein [Varunaivibrio sulfuroxidans]TCS60581.1 hypothetical protein EDD55_11055 [Varunaivibrio sulfuroxidans]WES30072.1 hypothetical protein P3M64_10540 [Varunaivibrio sulfuroxidans]